MTKTGMDLGSRFVKICIENEGKLSFYKYNTIDFYKKYISRDSSGQLKIEHSFLDNDNSEITATGYGRNLMSFSNAEVISEIKAHFKGARKQTGLDDFVLIDIGGQDSKVIKAAGGFIDDFVMNDKCAASTGRFLENAANILRINIEEMAVYTENPCKFSSTCAIFSESEIIGKIAEGASTEEISAGVNLSVARRLLPLIKRFSKNEIYGAGGVVSLHGVKYFLQELLDKEINVLENYQYNAAVGCVA